MSSGLAERTTTEENADEHSTLGGRSRAPVLPLPYFEAWRGRKVPTEARLLLVSPLFPPSTEVGALRWQKFSHHFAERGWKVDVLAYEPSALKHPDPTRLEELPQGTRAYGIPAPDLIVDRMETKLRRLLQPLRRRLRSLRARHRRSTDAAGEASESRGRWNRRGWLSPERIRDEAASPRGAYRAYRAWRHFRQATRWAEAAADIGSSLAISVRYRAIVSSGPPHRAHLAAREIAHRTGLPLVLDFRDPWSLIEGLPEDMASPIWLRHAARSERECVNDAVLIVANSEPHRQALASRYPEASDRTVTVLNGFDGEVRRTSSDLAERFLVVYTGSIYGGRDPRPVLRAAGEVVRQLDLTPEEFGIEFIGRARSFHGSSTASLAANEGLADHFEATGLLTREEAVNRASKAHVLLNLPQESRLCIPAKLYEYLQMPGRILALEHPGSATELLLRETDADVVPPDDVAAMARVLRQRYEEHTDGGSTRSDPPDPALRRSSQAERLLEVLEDRLP